MDRLFLFLYQYRAFFTFVFLEVVCGGMIVSSNHYQRALFFNSSGATVANINSFTYNIKEYFNLKDINDRLAEENARLRTKLENLEGDQLITQEDRDLDSTITAKWEIVSARVVNNSIDRFTNFITIDKGSGAGLAEGMAVISHSGVIGKIKSTSRNYSVLTSLLNVDVMVSAMLKRTGHFGTVQWQGTDPQYVALNFIPPHVKPIVGDSVVTSSYNAVFPPGIMIGTVEEVELSEAAQFYDLKVKLSQDFQKLRFVEVVKSKLKSELDSLEYSVNPELQ